MQVRPSDADIVVKGLIWPEVCQYRSNNNRPSHMRCQTVAASCTNLRLVFPQIATGKGQKHCAGTYVVFSIQPERMDVGLEPGRKLRRIMYRSLVREWNWSSYSVVSVCQPCEMKSRCACLYNACACLVRRKEGRF